MSGRADPTRRRLHSDMRASGWLVLVGVVAALVLWRREDIAEGVARVYYATTQDSRENEERYALDIAAAEARRGIPPGLLHRLIYQESRFRSDIISGEVVSSAGAIGIAQIVPRWHPGVDPLDPIASIEYAALYLAQLYQQFGSWRTALAAYNWGPGNVSRHLRENGALVLAELPTETRNYVEQITAEVSVA